MLLKNVLFRPFVGDEANNLFFLCSLVTITEHVFCAGVHPLCKVPSVFVIYLLSASGPRDGAWGL